jgi:murein peptide amidase A
MRLKGIGISALLFLAFSAAATRAGSPAAGAAPGPAASADHGAAVRKWCARLREEIAALRWHIEPCQDIAWKVGGESVEGFPLVYAEFGDPAATNVSLVLAAVHGDEITPVYLGLKLVRWLLDHRDAWQGRRVVVAPLVNPDGFLRRPRTRTNARGVDVNRNFRTADWETSALRSWKTKYRSDPRRFPGSLPRSEPETLFQEELITRHKPQKILSVHSPLGFIDYDGPSALSLSQFPHTYVEECLRFRKRMRAISSGFFPGSLGNFAGQGMGIPTITLELPTADAAQAEAYWKRFAKGIRTMIESEMPALETFPPAAWRPRARPVAAAP